MPGLLQKPVDVIGSHRAVDRIQIATDDADVLVKSHRIVKIASDIRTAEIVIEARAWAYEATDRRDAAKAIDREAKTYCAERIRHPA